MCQATEIHGILFQAPDIRQVVMRKEGAKWGRDRATRQATPLTTPFDSAKSAADRRFQVINKELKSIKTT
jgi:hypothetical protein